MNDSPVRSLALEMSDPFARQLLESARSDGPEPGARDRALLGLGLAPVGLLAAAPPAAAAATASALGASGKAVPWLVGKSLAIGLLGSLAAIGVLDRALGGSAQPAVKSSASATSMAAPSAHQPSLAAPSSTVVVPTSAPALASSVPNPSVIGAERPPETSRAPLGAPTSAPSVAPHGDGLLQVEALARVRRALATHEPGRALALLDDFERRFPASQVAEEAAVLRIETLHALGRTSEAHALGLRFARERPFSVYAARVNAMMQVP